EAGVLVREQAPDQLQVYRDLSRWARAHAVAVTAGLSAVAAVASGPGRGVPHGKMTPSTTTVPSARSARTRTGTSGSVPVHRSGSVSAMQVTSVSALAG